MNWRITKDEKPVDGQECLTCCKYGMIQGSYDASDGAFCGYYWQDMTWYADKWIPVEEVKP